MITKQSVDKFVRQRPFRPFEARMADGQKFRCRSIEEFIVGRDDIAVLTRGGYIAHFSIGLIASLKPLAQRRPRRKRA